MVTITVHSMRDLAELTLELMKRGIVAEVTQDLSLDDTWVVKCQGY